MQSLLFIIHVLVSITLITLVLMQHGKGADIGASFGAGASQTIFGSQGSGSFLVKLTGILAVVFFLTSLSLGYLTAQQAKQAQLINLPVSKTPASSTYKGNGS